MFQRFEQGVELINNGNLGSLEATKLFQGILYICVKDVQPTEYSKVAKEFGSKIQDIILGDEDGSFAKKMYQLKPNVKVEPV